MSYQAYRAGITRIAAAEADGDDVERDIATLARAKKFPNSLNLYVNRR